MWQMLPYWFLFFLPVVGGLFLAHNTGVVERFAWWGVLTIICLAIGLRHQVGGDWVNYLIHFDEVAQSSLDEVIEYSDPGYYVLSWAVAEFGGDIYWLNFLCGVIVTVGLGIFCRAQPRPWTALAVSVPYLVVVVAMGYTRQATALGCALVGLTYLGRQKTLPFVVAIMIGATFHKSAVLHLPIAALAASKSRLWTWLWVGTTTVLGSQLLLMEESERLWRSYVEQEMESEGGQIRVGMNAVPATLFLLLRRRLVDYVGESRLWWWLSVFSLVCIPLVSLASTAVDRVALYFIPLQVVVFSRLERSVKGRGEKAIVELAVISYYGLVQFIWLNYASHAHSWVPYQMLSF
jgi:hypothetical protein